MKNAKYILIGGTILIFMAYMLRFLWEPHSRSDLFEANYLSITPEKGTSSFDYFNVQEYNNTKYFLDKGNLVAQKNDSDKKEIQIENVGSFLITEDELVYISFDDTEKVYVKNLQNNKRKNISKKNAYILLNNNEYVYIYSEENILYKFDKLWNEVKKIDLNKNGFKGCFERACIIGDKLVFSTASLNLYVYDEQKETLDKVKIPKEDKHSKDGDIIKWKGNVYYMLSYYDDGDLHNSFTRFDSPQNGIYKLNVDNKKMEKVSDEVGEIMLVMNNELFIADSHFLGISYRINSADVEYADS